MDLGQSIALALQSLQIEPLAAHMDLTLHRALFSLHLRASIQAHDGDAVYLAISAAGDRLATSGGDPGEVKVWQVSGGVIDPAPLLTMIRSYMAEWVQRILVYQADLLARWQPPGGLLIVVTISAWWIPVLVS